MHVKRSVARKFVFPNFLEQFFFRYNLTFVFYKISNQLKFKRGKFYGVAVYVDLLCRKIDSQISVRIFGSCGLSVPL